MTEEQIGHYFNSLRTLRGLERQAARAAGVTIRDIRREREASDEFAIQEQEVLAEIAESVRAEVIRRAMDGIDEGVYFRGEKVATEKKYSDSLLLALARAVDPVFLDKKALVNGDGGPLKIIVQDFSHLSDKPPVVDVPPEAVTQIPATKPVLQQPTTQPQIPAKTPDKTLNNRVEGSINVGQALLFSV